MIISLRVVTGPLKDKVFSIDRALTIGRSGDIALNDPTVSGIHAKISQAGEVWVVDDNDSKNGIKIGEKRIKSAVLKPGITFYIGEHGFEVFETVAKKVPVAAPKAASAPVPQKNKKYWNEALVDFLKTNKDAFKDRTIPLAPLEPALVLEFVRGLQMNSKWTLGYGPRKLGPGTIDLPIWEPGAPEICFEIQPTPEGILFKTAHADVVLLNNQHVDSRILRMGDTISIHDTMIEVDFTE